MSMMGLLTLLVCGGLILLAVIGVVLIVISDRGGGVSDARRDWIEGRGERD